MINNYRHIVVAYLQYGQWYTVDEVRQAWQQRKSHLDGALPFTAQMLDRRRLRGESVPEWFRAEVEAEHGDE